MRKNPGKTTTRAIFAKITMLKFEFGSMKNKLSTQKFLYFSAKKAESPEFFHLLHFKCLKKCQQIECQHPY